MYRPQYSINEETSLALQLIKEFPLGILISTHQGRVETNYLPFLVHQTDNEIILVTHLAKANPQWKQLNQDVVVSFQGPNRYISPTIYVSKENVPTWNYAAVQIHGSPEIITDKDGLKKILDSTVHFFEIQNQSIWKYRLPNSIQEKLESAIIGLSIKVKRIEAKFKFSQNRRVQDYEAVLNYLKSSDNPKDRELFDWMLKIKD